MHQYNIDHLEDWKKGCSIAAQALQYGKGLVKEGASVLEVTEKIEAKIAELGGALAFPVNISVNDVAAHYTAKYKDTMVFGNDLVKLDIGAHQNGFLGDNAVTIDLDGKYSEYVKAAVAARNAAVKLCTPGMTLGEVGSVAEETAQGFDFKVIRNLSGHGIARWDAHVAPTIPNYDTGETTELEEGMVVAIEPFVTDGVGLIKDSGDYEIFNVREFKPLRMPFSRNITSWIQKKYNFLPFSRRELLLQGFSDAHVRMTLQQLDQMGALEKHAPLVEKAGGMVAQAEWTVMVKDKPLILTKLSDD